MADRFELCLDAVLRHEGGYADHPQDPGGATNMGITHKTLARWRQVSPWWDLPKSAVKDLTRAEAGEIYRASYWDRCLGDDLPSGLDLALFDYAVNSGPARAIKALQAILGVVADGQIGPLTLAAIGKRPAVSLVVALCDQRLSFLRRLTSFATFGRGWISRVAAVRKAALAGTEKDETIQTIERKTIMDILNGYKTYIVSIFMLLAGVLQMLGVDLPSLDGSSSGQLVMEALAVLFLRKGLKGDIGAA